MKIRGSCRRRLAASALIPIALLGGCEADRRSGPAEPRLSVAPGPGCDLSDALVASAAYFDDMRRPRPSNRAGDLLVIMEHRCAAGDPAGYTALWYRLAGVVEFALQTGQTADPADGNRMIRRTLIATLPSGAPAFDPCAGDVSCSPWGGHPAVPDFTAALSPGGAWSLISTGTHAVCSGHRSPCGPIDPDPSADGDVWGVEPSVTWEAALHGRTSLLWGRPLSGPSPTGEALLATPIPAYQWNLIPDPAQFAPDAAPPAVLEVGLCSIALARIDETLVQKGQTILQEAFLSFCPSQTSALPAASRLAGLLRRVGEVLDPRPRALLAAAFLGGPGGSAGGFSDFYAVDVPSVADWRFLNPPVGGRRNRTLRGAGGRLVEIQAITTSTASPLERATAVVTLEHADGSSPPPGIVTVDPGQGLTCDADNVCTGDAQADQQANPGALALPLQISRRGDYRICVTGILPPFTWVAPLCSGPFTIR